MNFIEALKSGNLFHRRSRGACFRVIAQKIQRMPQNGNYWYDDGLNVLSLEDFLANDWEIELQERTITRPDLRQAVDALKNIGPHENIFECLARNLGFTR